MDENKNNSNSPVVEPTQSPPPVNPDIPAPNPEQPVVLASSTSPKGSGRKTNYILVAIVGIMLISSAAAFFVSRNKSTPNQSARSATQKLTLPNQPKQLNDQFGTQNFTAGYVNYVATDFKPVDKAFPTIRPLAAAAAGTSTEKQVVFMNDISYNGAGNGHRLLMYDVDSRQTYVVDQSDSNGTYDNAKIMSNHYVVFAETVEIDPLTSNTNIKIVDLQTGKSQTVMTGKAADLPVSLCCAVTADGLRLVIPQTGKFLVYQAGEAQPTTFAVAVKVFPEVKGSGGGDYEAAQRNFGYPAITWLDDNRFMFAKSHPLKWTADSQGSHAATNNNGLAIYDLSTGKSTDIAKTSDVSIKWFSVDGNSLTYATYKPNVSGIADDNSGLTILKIDNFNDSQSQPLELLAVPLDYQSYLYYDQSSKKLYVQPAGAGLNEDTSLLTVLDTTTGTSVKKKIAPNYKSPYLRGFIGEDQAVIDDSYSVNNDYYIYNVQSDSSQLILSASS